MGKHGDTYSDGVPPARPCNGCGVDTAPGQPGHTGSMTDFIEYPCFDHDASGVIGVNCPDCSVQQLFFCADCRPSPQIDIEIERTPDTRLH